MKRLTYAFVIFLIAPSLLYANKMTLAVMDFKADGVSRKQARRISELIRTEMINTGKYTVVERKQINQILKEQGFQRTGCTDQDCAVKIGKLLSAKYILIGSVMKFGRSVVINGRIVDVEKGVGLFGQKQRARTNDDLFDTVNTFANRLTSRITGERITTRSFNQPIRHSNRNYQQDVDLTYHSPWLAGFSSLLPFWSGSFNKGFNGWGLGLVVLKISTTALSVLGFMDPGKGEYIIPGWIGLPLFMIVDVIFSTIVINKHNKKVARSISGFFKNDDDNFGEISFSLTPRMSNLTENQNFVKTPDGINFKVTYEI